MNSSSLRKILGLVLHLGQALSGDEARAIALSSLAQWHRAPGGAAFLECVVSLLKRHAPPILSHYHTELAPLLLRCQGISWPESLHELAALQRTFAALPDTVPIHMVAAAKAQLQDMEEPVQSTSRVQDQLRHYFGEDGATWDTMLPTLQQLGGDLEAALQRVQRRSSSKA
jgi:hypothetical protein